MQTHPRPVCFLFDNGSVRAASVLSLRGTAQRLERKLGVDVRAVSLLHSSGIDHAELDGVPAELLEPALNAFLAAQPQAEVVLLPLFFGPSSALTDYVPGRMEALAVKYPRARLRLARWLVDVNEPDERIAVALADATKRVVERHGLNRPRVVMVDHGSPQRAVAAVRDHLGRQMKAMLGDMTADVAAASMEKRPGSEYAFNDPLLAERLRTPPFDGGDVVVALQFLSPGRHAGTAGDIAKICDEARRERPVLRTYLTEPIANDARVIEVLARRYEAALRGAGC